MQGKKKIAIISLLLGYTIAVPVFAYMYFYQTEPVYVAAGVVLQTYPDPTMQIGVYWDENCTQPVTSIDFGQMIHPNEAITLWKAIYIRNEGDVWNAICFNSTLPFHYPVATEIADDWTYGSWQWGSGPNINGTNIEASTVSLTYYKVHIPAYATSGAYNWTLTVWGENYY